MPEQQEARIRSKYLDLHSASKQAVGVGDARGQPQDEAIENLVKQTNLRTGACDLLTLAVFSFLALLQMLAGPVSATEDKAGDKPPSDNA